MAIYEFRCAQCVFEFEVMRPFSQSHKPANCPRCGGLGEKLTSVFASTAGFGIKVPDKGAFRKPSPTKRQK